MLTMLSTGGEVNLNPNELIDLVLKVGGGLLAAFLAGSAIFYKIGWDAGMSACANLVP